MKFFWINLFLFFRRVILFLDESNIIKQSYNDDYFDFAIPLNKKEKETHGILSQIRLNKNKIQIFKIINATLNKYENLKILY